MQCFYLVVYVWLDWFDGVDDDVVIIPQEIACSPRPLDDSLFLQQRDAIITRQTEQIEMLTKQVARLMGGIDKVEDQVNVMQTQVTVKDEMFSQKKVVY